MENATCLVPLTQGKFAVVDAVDYDFLMQWKWMAQRVRTTYGFRWYARRHDGWPKRKMVSMYRVVAERVGIKLRECDHWDRDGLNNIRANLRSATHKQNCSNRTKSAGKTSRFKGVCWHKKGKKWRAAIKVGYKSFWLGQFSNEEDAANAYAKAAKRMFGEFACDG